MISEVWEPIEGYPNYEVSNKGNVRSLNYRGSTDTVRILEPIKTPNGYMHVTISQKGKLKQSAIHRLVAQAFIPNPDNKPQVNHINGDKADNRVSNLEWCDQSENQVHAYKKGLQVNPRRKPVMCVETGKVYTDAYAACKDVGGIYQSGISQCCLGRYKTTGGLHWVFANKEEITP